jgi:hypothetical protein
LRVQLVARTRPKEANVGRRDRRRGSQGRAEGRVRGRVRQRPQQRPQGRQSEGRRGAAFDVDEIEGYARRLRDEIEDNPGLTGAASGLAGVASGLAGGSLAHRLTSGGSGASEEDFGNEIRERLDLIDERLQRLEDEVRALREEGESAPGDLTEPGPAQDTEGNL